MNEIPIVYISGRTIYGVVRKKTGEVYDTTVSPYHSTNSWVSWNSSNVGDYDITVTDKSGDMYNMVFPSAITDAGSYLVQVRRQATGAPADGDVTIPGGAEEIDWSGTAILGDLDKGTSCQKYLGDYKEFETIYFLWSFKGLTSGTVKVYKDDGVDEVTVPTGITDTRDFDSKTGVHLCKINLATSSFYEAKADYSVVVTAAALGGSTVNLVIATFSIENRWQDIAFERNG